MAEVAGAVVLALSLAIIGPHFAGVEAPSGGRLPVATGDFLAFWTGAVMVHDGAGASFYDITAQRDLQARILGGSSPSFQPYLNPPLFAVLLSPLVPLGYRAAFYVYDLASVAMLALGLVMLVRAVPAIRALPGGTWTLILLAASYQPMLLTTLGGQNTAVTFALLAGLVLALQRGSTTAAAIALGLLTYKPQFAVGAGLALLLAGRWRVVAGGVALGAAHWMLGAWQIGARWPLDMLAFLRTYVPFELESNAQTHFSWVRTADYVFPAPLGGLLALAGVSLVLAAWWRFRALGRNGSVAWMSLVVCGTMLASPHLQYYDVALLVLPVCLLIDRQLARDGAVPFHVRALLVAALAGYPLWSYATWLHVQPLFFVLLGVSAWAVRSCAQAERCTLG